jgi:large subunit ribosomal protein L29
MARLRPGDLRQLSVEDLERKLVELTDERFRMRFRSATEAVENPLRFRTIRRDLARIRTILRERKSA